MSAYADGNDLVARYDIDLVGDLATDDRESLDRLAIVSHPRVDTALTDASGEVEVALLAGGRYTVAQLQGLQGNAMNHLKQIVCGLAMAALYRRRPESADAEFIKSITEDARAAVLALRRGENVFGIVEVIEAGIQETTGPSALDIRHRNGLTERMSRFFPTAQSRLPLGR